MMRANSVARTNEYYYQRMDNFFHPLVLDELDTLIAKVENLKSKDSTHYLKKKASKRLAAIAKLAFNVTPQDPTIPEYRQGSTLGEDHKHWFRAKFFQQYRLFFRFDSASKVIVFAWVNDEHSQRTYGSRTDVYRVFGKMLNNGHPPNNWNQLLKEAKGELDRLNEIANKLLR